MPCGAWTRRAGPACGCRNTASTTARAPWRSSTPRIRAWSPTSRPTRPTCCSAAAGDDTEITWYSEGEPGAYTHAAARDELWGMRSRMSAYGRALLLLLLDDAEDARGNELAQALAGEAQTRGDVSWWAVDRDPLLFDAAETSIEATAFAVQALARRDPKNPLVERARALDDGQPHAPATGLPPSRRPWPSTACCRSCRPAAKRRSPFRWTCSSTASWRAAARSRPRP